MSIHLGTTNYLPFNPGDWVRVVKKPRNAIAIKKDDVIQVDQVNIQQQMIRTMDTEYGWQYLGFDELEAVPSAPEPVVTGTTEMSSRERQEAETPHVYKILAEIQEILSRLQIWEQNIIIEKLMSSRDDTIDNEIVSELQEYPRIVWRSPGGRTAKYPWFECGKLRAYIGGGDRNSPIAQKRVALVQEWINQGIPPTNIYRRVKSKQFQS
ncbi:MAG: hypothetical protein WBA13_08400 [Microcoleaceae cyanobacterium]